MTPLWMVLALAAVLLVVTLWLLLGRIEESEEAVEARNRWEGT